MVGNIIYSLLKGKLWSDHRIGWRENFNRKPLYLMVKPMGFLVKIFPWKPIHWTSSIVDTWKIFSVCPSWLSRIFPYEKKRDRTSSHPLRKTSFRCWLEVSFEGGIFQHWKSPRKKLMIGVWRSKSYCEVSWVNKKVITPRSRWKCFNSWWLHSCGKSHRIEVDHFPKEMWVFHIFVYVYPWGKHQMMD